MPGLQTLPSAKVTVSGSDIATQNLLDIYIHLGCTKETNSFEVIVNNSNPDYYEGQYSPGGAKEFTLASTLSIKIKRGTITGSTKTLITGKIESIEYVDEAEEYGFKDVVYLRGRCLGQDLFSRKFDGDLIAAAGSGKAETIVTYLIENYTSLSHTRAAVDLIQTSNTSFTEFLCSHESIFDLIKYISEVASTAEGVIGYDAVIEYDGTFAWRPKSYAQEPYSLEEEFQIERYLVDMSRIKNKIWVYGKADKPYPLDVDGQNYSDAWTETYECNLCQLALDASASQKVVELPEGGAALYGFIVGDSMWLIDANSRGEECVIASIVVVGGQNDKLTMVNNLVYSYQVADYAVIWKLNGSKGWGYRPGTQWNELGLARNASVVDTGSYSMLVSCLVNLTSISVRFVLPEGAEVDLNKYTQLLFKLYFETTTPDGVRIYLYSGDCQSNSFAYSPLLTSFEADKWSAQTLGVGEKSASSWTIFSTFNWSDVKMIEFIITYPSPSTYSFRIDRFHFCGKRWGGGSDNSAVDGFAEDVGVGSSQALYGIKELVIVEDSLLSDAECEAKAQAYLTYLKSPSITLTIETKTLDLGDNAISPGNDLYALSYILGLDDYFRVDSADIRLSSEDHVLSFMFNLESTPPRLADYLYYLGKLTRTINRDYPSIR